MELSEERFADRRDRMVLQDLRKKGIRDPGVLAAFQRIPRHLFVPAGHQAKAYGDHPLDIDFGQTISQPYMAAYMTEQLRVEKTHRVLEIGTGSGYQTALLAELAGEVYTVEVVPELAQRAQEAVGRIGYTNVHYRLADGSVGWPEEAPFDRILVTAAAPSLPVSLTRQVAESGGRMIIPVGDESRQDLLLVTREAGRLDRKAICGCVFVKLRGKEGWE